MKNDGNCSTESIIFDMNMFKLLYDFQSTTNPPNTNINTPTKIPCIPPHNVVVRNFSVQMSLLSMLSMLSVCVIFAFHDTLSRISPQTIMLPLVSVVLSFYYCEYSLVSMFSTMTNPIPSTPTRTRRIVNHGNCWTTHLCSSSSRIAAFCYVQALPTHRSHKSLCNWQRPDGFLSEPTQQNPIAHTLCIL